MSKHNLFTWLNHRSRHTQQLNRFRAYLSQDAEKHLWSEHPNDYRSKDLGYQTIARQRVKVKRIYETNDRKGPNWLVVDGSFKVSV